MFCNSFRSPEKSPILDINEAVRKNLSKGRRNVQIKKESAS
jgi:hypothetical protein